MPRVTILHYVAKNEFLAAETSFAGFDEDSGLEVQVDMNASLWRQIQHAEKQYRKFQDILRKFYKEAQEHPNTIRRVR
jgi:hypothetical protein